MSTSAVQLGTEITLHFSLSLETGELVDSTRERSPATFVFGDGSLPAGFEQCLLGMSVGEHQVHRVLPEQAFGQANPNNVQEFPRQQFDAVELAEGLVLAFADAAKAEVPGVVKAFDEQTVTIDFNHPLAGRTLLFEVEILDITPAD